MPGSPRGSPHFLTSSLPWEAVLAESAGTQVLGKVLAAGCGKGPRHVGGKILLHQDIPSASWSF